MEMGGVNNTFITKIVPSRGQTQLPNISNYDLLVIKLGFVTAARMILSLEKYVLSRG